jgi:hypothetical protein
VAFSEPRLAAWSSATTEGLATANANFFTRVPLGALTQRSKGLLYSLRLRR